MASKFSVGELERQAESLLTCSVCMEPYRSPRILPCQHTFCLPCLERCYRAANPQLQSLRLATFPCPTCRKICHVPAVGGLEALPADFKVAQVRDLVENLKIRGGGSGGPGSGVETCVVCRCKGIDRPAAVLCVSCSKNLCADCADQHRANALFRDHETRPIVVVEPSPEVEMPAPPPRCRDHNEDVGFFCCRCDALVCTLCVMTTHDSPEHRVVTLADAAGVLHDRLSTDVAEHLRRLKVDVEARRRLVERLVAEKRRVLDRSRAAVVEQARAAQLAVADGERRLLTELDAVHERGIADTDAAAAAVDKLQTDLAQMSESVERAIVSSSKSGAGGGQGNDVAELNGLIERIRRESALVAAASRSEIPMNVRQCPIFATRSVAVQFGVVQEIEIGLEGENEPVFTYVEPEAAAAAASTKMDSAVRQREIYLKTNSKPDSNIGCWSSRERYEDECETSSSASASAAKTSVVGVDDENDQKEQQRRRRRRSPPPPGLVWKSTVFRKCRGVAFLDDGELAAAEYDERGDRLRVFDVDGAQLRRMTGTIVARPWALWHSADAGSLTVTDHGSAPIKILKTSLTTRDLSMWRATVERPTGIAMTRAGSYVITDTGRRTPKIGIYAPRAGRIAKVAEFGDDDDGDLRSPHFVTVDGRGRIIVADADASQVVVFSEEGRRLMQFSTDGKTTSASTEGGSGADRFLPFGVTVDELDNILVADQSGGGRVVRFSPEGLLVDTPVVDTEGVPWGLAYNIEEHLLAVGVDGGPCIYRI